MYTTKVFDLKACKQNEKIFFFSLIPFCQTAFEIVNLMCVCKYFT